MAFVYEFELQPRKVSTQKYAKDSLYPYDDLVMNEEFLRNPTSNNNTQEDTPINLFSQKVTIPELGIENTSLRYVKRCHRDLLFPSLCIRRIDEDDPDKERKLHQLHLSSFRIRQSHNRFNTVTYQRESRLIKAAETFKVKKEPHTSGYRNKAMFKVKQFQKFVKTKKKTPKPYLKSQNRHNNSTSKLKGSVFQTKQEPKNKYGNQIVTKNVLANPKQGSLQKQQLKQSDKSPQKPHNNEDQETSLNEITINQKEEQKQKQKQSDFSNLNTNRTERKVRFTDFSYSSDEGYKKMSIKQYNKAKKRQNEASVSEQRNPIVEDNKQRATFNLCNHDQHEGPTTSRSIHQVNALKSDTNLYIKHNDQLLEKMTAEKLTGVIKKQESNFQNQPSSSSSHPVRSIDATSVRKLSSLVNQTHSTDEGHHKEPSTSGMHIDNFRGTPRGTGIIANYQLKVRKLSSLTNSTHSTGLSHHNNPNTSGSPNVDGTTSQEGTIPSNTQINRIRVRKLSSLVNPTHSTDSSHHSKPNTSESPNVNFDGTASQEETTPTNTQINRIKVRKLSSLVNSTHSTDSSHHSEPNTSESHNVNFDGTTSQDDGAIQPKTQMNSISHPEIRPPNYQNSTNKSKTESTQNKPSTSGLQNIHATTRSSRDAPRAQTNQNFLRIQMDFQVKKSILEAVSEASQKWVQYVHDIIENDEPNDQELRPIALRMLSEACDDMLNKCDKRFDMNEFRNKILKGASDIMLESIPEGSTSTYLKRIHGELSTYMLIKHKRSQISSTINSETNTPDEIEALEDQMLSYELMLRRLVGHQQYLSIMRPTLHEIFVKDDNNLNQKGHVEVQEENNQEKVENRGCNHTTYNNDHHGANPNPNSNPNDQPGNSTTFSNIIIEAQIRIEPNEVRSENTDQANQPDRPSNDNRNLEVQTDNEPEEVRNTNKDQSITNEQPGNAAISGRIIEAQIKNEPEEVSNENTHETNVSTTSSERDKSPLPSENPRTEGSNHVIGSEVLSSIPSNNYFIANGRLMNHALGPRVLTNTNNYKNVTRTTY